MGLLDRVSDFAGRARKKVKDKTDRVKKWKKKVDHAVDTIEDAGETIQKVGSGDFEGAFADVAGAVEGMGKRAARKAAKAAKRQARRAGKVVAGVGGAGGAGGPVMMARTPPGTDMIDFLPMDLDPDLQGQTPYGTDKGAGQRILGPIGKGIEWILTGSTAQDKVEERHRQRDRAKAQGGTMNPGTVTKVIDYAKRGYGAYRAIKGALPAPSSASNPAGVEVGYGPGGTEIHSDGLYVVAIAAGVLQAAATIPKGYSVKVVAGDGSDLGWCWAARQIPKRALLWFNHPQNTLNPAYWPGLKATPNAAVYTEGGTEIPCVLLSRKPKRRRKTLTPKRLARFRQLARMVESHDKLVKKTKRMCKMR